MIYKIIKSRAENTVGIAYFFLRVAMGINLLGHGLARIPKLQAFATGMTNNFEKSWLPQEFVYAWGLLLPFVEFMIGLLLVMGLKTRIANIAGAALICSLLFGSSTLANWEAMGIQMIYMMFFYFLILKANDNHLSIDSLIKHKTIQK